MTMDQQPHQHDGTKLRIDGAHELAQESPSPQEVAAPPSADLVAAAAGIAEDLHEEQTQLQGHQLVMELTRRQREIDRRESQFNAFLATLEREARSERVKQSDREDDLAGREQECAARLDELTQREVALRNCEELEPSGNSDDHQLRKLRRELEEKRIRLEAEENGLRFRQQKMQTQREASMQLVRHLMRSAERRRDAIEQQAASTVGHEKSVSPSDVTKLTGELEERHRGLVESQAAVDETKRKLEAESEQFRAEREEWDATRQREQARFQQQQNLQRTEHQQREELLQRRGDEIAKRQAALDQMQANVTRTHREALELRLATEQLWSQIGEKTSPQALAETLGQLRSKISEHYQVADESLANRRDELQAMAVRLDDQQMRIQNDREELQKWFERRNEEVEFQAARLVAREQELESQQAQNAAIREKWDQQRHDYEDEIRRLQAKLRKSNLAAA